MKLWLRDLWAIRRRPICWVKGHVHTEKRGNVTMWAVWCMRCYGDWDRS